MEDQSQAHRWFNQEYIRSQNQGYYLSLPDYLFPTRANNPNHWGNHPCQVLGNHCFVDFYLDYCYVHIVRVTSDEDTLQAKDHYKNLTGMHWTSVCAYMEENGGSLETLYKEEVQKYGQHISYCGVG